VDTAIGTAYTECEECGERLPVALIPGPSLTLDGLVRIPVRPDFTDVYAHAWTHEEE